MAKRISSDELNFKKAVRYEMPFDDKIIAELCWNATIDIRPEDLLCGLKRIKSLGKNKAKSAYNSYIKKLSKIYDEYGIDSDMYLSDNDQYPAPRGERYVDYIVYSKRKYPIDDAIKILDTYVKNAKKPFANKMIPDVALIDMFEDDNINHKLRWYENDEKVWKDKKFQKKIVELIDRAEKLGCRNALFEKAVNYYSCLLDRKGAAAATEKLIKKYNDYSALCEYGYANRNISAKRLIKYYNQAIELGYPVEEELARLVSGRYPYYSDMNDNKLAMQIRKKAYDKYKKAYQKNKNEKTAALYGYAAYCLGKANLDEWIGDTLDDLSTKVEKGIFSKDFKEWNSKYNDFLDKLYDGGFNKKNCPYEKWLGYINEAKKHLKYGFMMFFPFTSQDVDMYDVRGQLEELIFFNITEISKFNLEKYYADGAGLESY